MAGISASAAQAAPAAAYGAPVVEVSVPAGVLSSEQKGDMIRRITDVVLTTLNLPPDPQRHMFVEVFETSDSGFGVDGKVFTPVRK
jgi:phenylpyruvate tautomerase PptA (4-oxalocrotonate tautomerase family)